MYSLNGHTAIVTGGASGIGRATVGLLAEAGANVVIADINEEAGAQVVQELTEQDVAALFVKTDVTQGDDVDALVQAAAARFGSRWKSPCRSPESGSKSSPSRPPARSGTA